MYLCVLCVLCVVCVCGEVMCVTAYVVVSVREVDVEATVAREGHLEESDDETAVAPIVASAD